MGLTDIQINTFVNMKKNDLKHLLMEEIPDDLSTNECQVLYTFIGLNPKSTQYGDIIGAFQYKGDVYTFRFHVHSPKQGSASLSNRMTNYAKVGIRTFRDMEFLEEKREDSRFSQAFWVNTPDKYLDADNLAMRLLMKNICDYSRSKDFCKQLRKTDETHNKIMELLYEHIKESDDFER